jgi:hypothetical protein
MNQSERNLIYRFIVVLLPAVILASCANIGNPNGGPYDEDYPKVLGSKPAMNQLNYTGKKIEVYFDEFVSVEKPSENVIVTPPQKQSPVIQSLGKKVLVELKDSLLENTTYTIDFTSSIVDNNEKNALENFSFAFSTGDVIDTMEIAGILMNAEDNEPMQNIMVGIQKDLSDTAFIKLPFLRTSRTNDRGHFIIRNIAPGSYHVFALNDNNRNYAYDKAGGEAFAFLDSIIVPSCERALVPDTVWKDTVTVDTVMMVEKTLYYPDDLHLWLSVDSVSPKQRMSRPERPQDNIFTLKFNAPLDTFPVPVPLNFNPADSLWYITVPERSAEAFSINYWILDSMIYKIDSLQIELSYFKDNDTVPGLKDLQTDTVLLVNRETAQRKMREARVRKPVKIRPAADASRDTAIKEEDRIPAVPLQVNISPQGTINPYDIISIRFNEPVMDVRKEFFTLETGVDTLWEKVDFDIERDSLNMMIYYIKRPFKYEERYMLTIDSAALHGVYGRYNDFISAKMSVRSDKEYGHLFVKIESLPYLNDSLIVPAIVELLNSGGATVRSATVKNGVADFKDMAADSYFVKLILDENGNGKWDGGNYEEKRQPEKVIYLDKQLKIIENWKWDETWDIRNYNTGSKPAELLKNKPKEETKKKRDYKSESNPGRSNSNMGVKGLF